MLWLVSAATTVKEGLHMCFPASPSDPWWHWVIPPKVIKQNHPNVFETLLAVEVKKKKKKKSD